MVSLFELLTHKPGECGVSHLSTYQSDMVLQRLYIMSLLTHPLYNEPYTIYNDMIFCPLNLLGIFYFRRAHSLNIVDYYKTILFILFSFVTKWRFMGSHF